MELKNLAKVAINKSLLKEYNNSGERIVYLSNGDEFQIQLFNPYTYTIGADISINGKKLSNRLIIRPGERIWLERFFDSPDKFLFSTYTVNGTSREVKEAIKNNGIISISFYKEKEKTNNVIWVSSITTEDLQPYTYKYKQYNDDYTIYCDNCDNILEHSNSISSLSAATSAYYSDSNITCAPTSAATYTSLTSNIDSNIKCGTNSKANFSRSSRSLETGRIEKGSHSNQSFETCNIDFEYWHFKQETIKILPKSQKQYTAEDLEKKYCHNCGRKIKNKFKYCPFCGAEQ